MVPTENHLTEENCAKSAVHDGFTEDLEGVPIPANLLWEKSPAEAKLSVPGSGCSDSATAPRRRSSAMPEAESHVGIAGQAGAQPGPGFLHDAEIEPHPAHSRTDEPTDITEAMTGTSNPPDDLSDVQRSFK